MEDKLLELLADAVVAGLNVDDGTQLMLSEDVVAFGLATTDDDDALRHGQKCIHGGGIAVELVHHDIAGVHEVLINIEGQALGLDTLQKVGVLLSDGLGCLEHDIGAFVGAASFADADEEAEGLVLWKRIGGGG